MNDQRRHCWEDRHREANDIGAASPFVERALDILAALAPPGTGPPRALDVACGRGRHALLLATRGYAVDALDFSLAALGQLRRAGIARGLAIHCLAADATTWAFPQRHYALVVVVNFLERALVPALQEAVMPGGALLYETHVRADETPVRADGGSASVLRPAFVLEPGELEAACRGWRILLSHTSTAAHGGKPVARAGILALRPQPPAPHAPAH